MITGDALAEQLRKNEEERYALACSRLENYLKDSLPSHNYSIKKELSSEEEALFNSRIPSDEPRSHFSTRVPVIFEDDLGTKVGVYYDVHRDGFVTCALRNNQRYASDELIDYVLQRERNHYVKLLVEDEKTAQQIIASLQDTKGILEMETYKASAEDRDEDSNDLLYGNRGE